LNVAGLILNQVTDFSLIVSASQRRDLRPEEAAKLITAGMALT
jgi:hypothetical protein